MSAYALRGRRVVEINWLCGLALLWGIRSFRAPACLRRRIAQVGLLCHTLISFLCPSALYPGIRESNISHRLWKQRTGAGTCDRF